MPAKQLPRISDLAQALAKGKTTSRALTESALERAEDAAGEGRRVFIQLYREQALAAADASDAFRAQGAVPSVLAGIPISIKDLFDVAGEVTKAGSRVLADADPAARDAPVIRRLRAAGAILMGRTNMTEFAYSGLGLNPHYDTPRNPYDRETGRIPGGSSSGAAVSVTDGMAVAAIGTDTGGSVRIPAAFCGLTGFKPTPERVPRDGALPLSTTLDSIGPLAASVSCCAELDAIMTDEPVKAPEALPVKGLRLGLPQTMVLDNLDTQVSGAFWRALDRLSAAGASVIEFPFGEINEIPEYRGLSGFTAPESYAWHRDLLARGRHLYDPRVSVRMVTGADIPAADYIDTFKIWKDVRQQADLATAPFDAVVMPTTATIAPSFAEVAQDEDYFQINSLTLRNTYVGNFFHRCAISLPCHNEGEAPVGLMLMGETDGDRRLLSLALGVERALSRISSSLPG
ncbi:amidase [Pelagibius sp. Alg239-R121]|uniref:amidase n=1 Tax=Pelagibius sp. Alg239-R121 TaxID=2993448 RepID=UPI0024A693B1|nr:amidase [Pelagibius sp. Alg239-R121]